MGSIIKQKLEYRVSTKEINHERRGNSKKTIDEKFCHECGETINAKAEICPKCGVRQTSAVYGATNGKTKIAAALFAFFLGSFGAHKFYLGQIGLGILYLVFFWTFIPSIVAFIEFILFLTMTDKTFNEKYGKP